MSIMSEEKDQLTEEQVQGQENGDVQSQSAETVEEGVNAGTDTEEPKEDEPSELEKAQAELTESKDKYLRLYSEFENFRRRTSKERIELISTANKELVENLVPVLDDFERALKAMDENEETKPAQEGTELIYNKFKKVLEAKGLKKMEVGKGDEFNDDYHEAITQIPAGEELAGKIVDVVENGYFLGDKVVRFAKVVTGAKT